MVTWASATARPCSSITVPRIEPVSVCANTVGVRHNASITPATTTANRVVLFTEDRTSNRFIASSATKTIRKSPALLLQFGQLKRFGCAGTSPANGKQWRRTIRYASPSGHALFKILMVQVNNFLMQVDNFFTQKRLGKGSEGGPV